MKEAEYIIEDLFEKRNKSYGVYALRRSYNKFILISFGVAVSVISLAFLSPQIIKIISGDTEGKLTVKDVRSVEYAALASPPPIEASTPKEFTPALKPKMKSTVKFVKPVPKPDEEVIEDETVPTQEELQDVDAALQTVEGDDDGVLFYGDEMEVLDGQNEDASAEPLTIVQIMPSFPGGESKLFQFLSNELRYPARARETGIQGTVVTQFVIETDGSITEIEILRSLSSDCDEEVIRVLESMPLWSPGIQNQMKVRVKFTLPVNFVFK